MVGSSDDITTQRADQLSMSVDYPRLFRLNHSDIRRFIRVYDQYVTEIRARRRQLGKPDSGTEETRPVDLNFCVDIYLLHSAIILCLI